MEILNRWETPEGRKTSAEVVSRLRRRKPLDKLPLDTVDGRWDLRGFRWPTVDVKMQRLDRFTAAVATRKLPELRGVQLSGVDFSQAVLPHLRLFDSTVSDCVFDGALMGDLRAWRTSFEHCDLTGADLRGSLVGGWDQGKGNVWRHCRFASTSLQKIVVRGAVFEDCVFDNAGIGSLAVDACTFRRVRFVGPLVDIAFYGPTKPDGPQEAVLEDVDLTEARVSGLMFVGLRLSGVRFPADGDFAVFPDGRARLQRVLEALEGDSSEEAYALTVLARSTIKQYRDDSDLYVNYDDLARDVSVRGAELMRRLVSD
ncbi:MAG: pentapeptide repeat-containing protein [Catenulispora sp.]|nr:pentapeptide repeat-containing protein [Catenulispora sp.]